MKSINLLKILARTSWGANHSSLLTIYRSVIRSKLDYGSIVYGSARKSYLSKLEPIANAALRLSLGAFRTSPIPSLLALSGEPPLSIRRDQLALQFYYKLNSNIRNPAYSTIFNNRNFLFQRNPNTIQPLNLRLHHLTQTINPYNYSIAPYRLPKIPPWILYNPTILWNLLHSGNKTNCSPTVYVSAFNQIKDTYSAYTPVFTDGSKENNKAALAVIFPSKVYSQKLPYGTSIYTAELLAIRAALQYISRYSIKASITFTDSLSLLYNLLNLKNYTNH